MERHVWLRALAVSLAPPRSYRVSARMHRRNGLRAFRLHAIHDAPGHRECVTNVISWGRNHRYNVLQLEQRRLLSLLALPGN